MAKGDAVDAQGPTSLLHYLEDFGYVAPDDRSQRPAELTTRALARFQALHGLPVTGQLDRVTRKQIETPRCAHADLERGNAFQGRCAWERRALTFAFGSSDYEAPLGGTDAVRRA